MKEVLKKPLSQSAVSSVDVDVDVDVDLYDLSVTAKRQSFSPFPASTTRGTRFMEAMTFSV